MNKSNEGIADGLFAFYPVLMTCHPFPGFAVVSTKRYKMLRGRQQCPQLKPTMPSVPEEERLLMLGLFQDGISAILRRPQDDHYAP
ncbi:hypothetical protein HPB48_010126 [Haemaphysalis longicornis]|uniref:Uncharacterized protein n=1 Tax=Haemaphysalis longicornis TaxID=44386 RepID=A0A9J6GFI5_HAELO|nr:hypothetical protein HPB48_010126 [Haemaphysalis longicornis]